MKSDIETFAKDSAIKDFQALLRKINEQRRKE
jgi:hypothetical protein